MKGTAKIAIIGSVGADFWYGGTSAASIIALLNDANANDQIKDIEIMIDSPGGDVTEGIQIFNAILNSAKPVTSIINSTAYSIAFVISQAAQVRKMYSNALAMAHASSTFIYGNANDLRQGADVLDKYDTTIAECLASKTGLTVDEVKAKYLNYNDVFMTATEAKDAGFVDEVISVSQKSAMENINRRDVKAVLAYYQELSIENRMQQTFTNNEATLIDKILNRIKPAAQAQFTPDTMKLTNTLALLSAMDAAANPQVAAALAEANTYANDERFNAQELADAVSAAVTTATNSLQEQINTLTEQLNQRTNELNEAVRNAAEGATGAAGADAHQAGGRTEKTWKDALNAMPFYQKHNIQF